MLPNCNLFLRKGGIWRGDNLHTKIMQNLFSFFKGLFSELLYAMAEAVLLFDKLVCTLYDLPLWRCFGRRAQALGQRRIICALAAFVPVFFVPGALLMKGGTLVTVNGRPIGLVESPETLNSAVSEIEQSASEVSGTEYKLPLEIETRSLGGTEDQFITESELKTGLIKAAGELDTLAVISVDGKQAAVCRTTEDAQTLLDRVITKYTAPTDGDARFMQQVRVDNVVAQTSLVPDLGTLYNELSNSLDVSATRAVTYTEAIPYETITRENDQLEKNLKQTVQKGREGEAVITAEIHTLDGHEDSRTVLERTVLCGATAEIIEIGTKETGIGTGELMVPVSGYTLTSSFKWRWGRLHGGVDLAVPEGTPVYAADDGKVIVSDDSGYGGGYGKYIILDHQNGIKTLYGHNSELLVSVDSIVKKGEKIALSGNTGNSTGPHLHFEVRENDEQVDPQQYVTLA